MKSAWTHSYQTLRRMLQLLCIAALAVVVAGPASAHSDPVPPVPANLDVPAGNKLFLIGRASGTQQYMCLFTGSEFTWTFFGPQATLFNANSGKPFITHFLSPNPAEGGAARPTWQHMNDGSTAWGAVIASSSDPNYVAPGAIPWLLLQVVGVESEPSHAGKLAPTTFIQRLTTSGGLAPSAGCTTQADIGTKALVPYTTDYFFYKSTGGKAAGHE